MPRRGEGQLAAPSTLDSGAERYIFKPSPPGTTMIARTWRGAVPAERADAYHDYLLRTGIPDYRATAGNMGVYVLRRVESGVAHFMIVTLWESIEAVRRFAGDDPARARYYPKDAEFLLELPAEAEHYDVLLAAALVDELDPPASVG